MHARPEDVYTQCREKWEVGAKEDWRYADMLAPLLTDMSTSSFVFNNASRH